MFHLFNKVYLEHEKWFSTKYESVILANGDLPHPVTRLSGFKAVNVPKFKEYIQSEFSGEEDNFWKSLINQNPNIGYNIFVDQSLFDQLMLTYWKNIFKDLDVENAYLLYKFNFLNEKLKRYNRIDRADNIPSDWENNIPMTLEKFSPLFASAPRIPSLLKLDKGSVSFEYLMANYFFQPDGPCTEKFLRKLKDFSWQVWFSDVEIMRGEIINSFYDIRRIIPDADLDILSIESVENFIHTEPKLKWLLDPDFNINNLSYVIKTYPKEVFVELAQAMHQCWGFKYKLEEPQFENKTYENDYILPTTYVFEGRYVDFLMKSINESFGCVFVNDSLLDKANQLLPLFIYEKVRSAKIEDLKFLRLS
jgi:hypothetical protein